MKMRLGSFMVPLLFLAIVPNANATLIGDNINADLRYPDVNTVILDYGSILVGGGVEIPAAFIDTFGQWSIDIGAASIRIDMLENRTPSAAGFNGFQFSDLDFGGGEIITGFALSTNISGYTASEIEFGPDFVRIDFGGGFGTIPQGSFVQVDLQVQVVDGQAVPAPSALLLVASGMIGLGGLAWRRGHIRRP